MGFRVTRVIRLEFATPAEICSFGPIPETHVVDWARGTSWTFPRIMVHMIPEFVVPTYFAFDGNKTPRLPQSLEATTYLNNTPLMIKLSFITVRL